MPDPNLVRTDRFAQAAGRHFRDAQILNANGRNDNVVYLSGYVVECSLKTVILLYADAQRARSFGHKLASLQTEALKCLRVLTPHADLSWPKGPVNPTVVEDGHPERRYWASGAWTSTDAITAIDQAGDLYKRFVVDLVLDGKLPAGELAV